MINSLTLALSKTDATRVQKLILRALDKKPNDPTHLYHQAQVLDVAGSTMRVVKVLELLMEQQCDFPEHKETGQMQKTLKE